MGYHIVSVEPLVRITGLDGSVIRLLVGIFIGKWLMNQDVEFVYMWHLAMPSKQEDIVLYIYYECRPGITYAVLKILTNIYRINIFNL